MLRREFAKALIVAGVGIAAPALAGESTKQDGDLLLLDDARRLVVNPGDVLVLSFPGRLSLEQRERLREHVNPLFPNNRVLVLTDGATIGVLGAD